MIYNKSVRNPYGSASYFFSVYACVVSNGQFKPMMTGLAGIDQGVSVRCLSVVNV